MEDGRRDGESKVNSAHVCALASDGRTDGRTDYVDRIGEEDFDSSAVGGERIGGSASSRAQGCALSPLILGHNARALSGPLNKYPRAA